MSLLSFIVTIISFIWFELCNAFFSGIAGAHLIFVCLFAAGFAYVLRIIVRNDWLLFVILEIFSLFFIIEYLTNASYSVFMSPVSIALGAGGVATEYVSLAESALVGGALTVALMELPPLVVFILNLAKPRWYDHRSKTQGFAQTKNSSVNNQTDKKNSVGFAKSILMLIPGFIVIIGSMLLMGRSSVEAYTYGYSYDNAVRQFGVLPAVTLDIKYSITGVPEYVSDAVNSENEPSVEADEEQKEPSIKDLGYKGLLKGKNLIIICGETFTRELIQEDMFPTIYRMATKGIQVEDFYQPAWGGSTSTGEASILLGLIPTEGVKTIQKFVNRDNSFTIANQLKAQGYNTFAIHNGDYGYYNRDTTHVALGYDQYIACGSGLKIDFKNWPKSDLEMMDFSVDLFKDSDPFCVYYMTISGHCQYSYAGNDMAKKHKEIAQQYFPDASERVQAYYAACYDLELGLASLLNQLDAAGKLQDTVIVMTGDHYPYAMEKGSTYNNKVNYLEELYGYATDTIDKRDHNALIIWSPVIEALDEPIIAEGVSYTPDILPTLYNLFGIDYDSSAFPGRDILSSSEGMAIWANGSWKTSKGFYNSKNGKFIGEADNEYIALHKDIAAQKIQQSRKKINEK